MFSTPVEPADALALASAIFRMGKTLRLSTVAEGVEEASQAANLLGIGCDVAQGFHYARPMPAREMGDFLRRAGTKRLAS